MTTEELAQQIAFDAVSNIAGSHGKAFDCIKTLEAHEKHQLIYVIRETIMEYFDKGLIQKQIDHKPWWHKLIRCYVWKAKKWHPKGGLA